MDKKLKDLRQLATAYGLQTSYINVKNQRIINTADSLLGGLKALNIQCESFKDVPEALQEFYASYSNTKIEPVHVIEADHDRYEIPIKLTLNDRQDLLQCELTFENNHYEQWLINLAELPIIETQELAGNKHFKKHPAPTSSLSRLL